MHASASRSDQVGPGVVDEHAVAGADAEAGRHRVVGARVGLRQQVEILEREHRLERAAEIEQTKHLLHVLARRI